MAQPPPAGGATVCSGLIACFGARAAVLEGVAAVVARPRVADVDLVNANDVRDAVCVVQRGTVPLVDKARRAQRCGALGVIIVNTDERPLLAHGHRHLNGTEDPGDDITIPVVVVPSSAGRQFESFEPDSVRDTGAGHAVDLSYDIRESWKDARSHNCSLVVYATIPGGDSAAAASPQQPAARSTQAKSPSPFDVVPEPEPEPEPRALAKPVLNLEAGSRPHDGVKLAADMTVSTGDQAVLTAMANAPVDLSASTDGVSSTMIAAQLALAQQTAETHLHARQSAETELSATRDRMEAQVNAALSRSRLELEEAHSAMLRVQSAAEERISAAESRERRKTQDAEETIAAAHAKYEGAAAKIKQLEAHIQKQERERVLAVEDTATKIKQLEAHIQKQEHERAQAVEETATKIKGLQETIQKNELEREQAVMSLTVGTEQEVLQMRRQFEAELASAMKQSRADLDSVEQAMARVQQQSQDWMCEAETLAADRVREIRTKADVEAREMQKQSALELEKSLQRVARHEQDAKLAHVELARVKEELSIARDTVAQLEYEAKQQLGQAREQADM